MLIVDAQVHIWRTGPPTNPAHRQITSFSADDLLKEMDEAGVDRVVINPPGWDPNSSELAIEAARQHPDRFSVLGHFPLDKEESRSLVDGWKQQPGMRGPVVMVDRWHHGLVVARCGTRRATGRPWSGQSCFGGRPNRRTTSGGAASNRSHGDRFSQER